MILSSCHALDFGVLHIIINFLAAGWPISIGIAFVGRENVKNIQKKQMKLVIVREGNYKGPEKSTDYISHMMRDVISVIPKIYFGF